MSIKLYENNTYEGKQRSGVGDNSMALIEYNFVTLAAGVVSLSAVGGIISWVNDTIATYAADNETVALAPVNFTPAESNRLYTVTITGGTITAADEGNFYDLATASTVDGTTESATTGQLQLIEFVSATSSVFKIVNA